MLAADYVRTYTDLATMEGANEAARRAVNAILDATGSRAARCSVWPLREPPALAPARALDRVLWRLAPPAGVAGPRPRFGRAVELAGVVGRLVSLIARCGHGRDRRAARPLRAASGR